MSFRLKSITIGNFRSIRGSHTIGLDAPIVLVHGPNGTGKTSLLSAIELGLTGDVLSLARIDDGYRQYLPHKKSPNNEASVDIEAELEGGLVTRRITLTRTAISGDPVLDRAQSKFFGERCYLAQSTLGRLLDIYQHQDARRTDSPLTRFVKELLGLEPLDSLINGLHASGDVRRMRLAVPEYWAARDELSKIDAELQALAEQRESAERNVAEVREKLQLLAGSAGLSSPEKPPTQQEIAEWTEDDNDEAELSELARTRRDLAAALEESARLAARVDASDRTAMENRSRLANDLLLTWRTTHGDKLDALIAELVQTFPDLQTSQVAGPAPAHRDASKVVAAEADRISGLITRDDQDAGRLADLGRAIEQGAARIETLDAQIQVLAGSSDSLAEALSAIVPHIHSNDCPVCGRDYGQVGGTPLKAHVSEQITTLLQTSARLQALVQDKSTTAAGMALAERERTQVTLRRITPSDKDLLKSRRARLSEISEHLGRLLPEIDRGSHLVQEAAVAARELADANSRDTGLMALRLSVDQTATAIDQPGLTAEEGVHAALERLSQFVVRREEQIEAAQALRREAIGYFGDIGDIGDDLGDCIAQIRVVTERRDQLLQAKSVADERIELAKGLVRSATDARTEIVRTVFNDDLNSVWRELFIRLAPEEPFVPAFALPSSASGPVEAVLETLYRAGGKGGNPRSMLSAGNLNTAALTLFLALHLSVKPTLPCLIIDDPVQSMDEVHIAQFAALLRTLARQKDRQIVIAVHERSLFEYLALELSPSFLDDRLITVELGRTGDGMTTSVWDARTFKPDLAVAA